MCCKKSLRQASAVGQIASHLSLENSAKKPKSSPLLCLSAQSVDSQCLVLAKFDFDQLVLSLFANSSPVAILFICLFFLEKE